MCEDSWGAVGRRITVTPGHQGRQNGPQVATFVCHDVLVADRALLVGAPVNYSFVDETPEPVGEHIPSDAEALKEILETGHPCKGLANDQQRPSIAHGLKGASDRAVLLGVVAGQHHSNLPASCMKRLGVATCQLFDETNSRAGCQRRPMSSEHHTPADIATAYLTAFYDGDHEVAASLVSDDFRFDGPFLKVNTKAAFFEGAAGLLPIVRGHRLMHQWADGDDVCSVYDVNIETPSSSGTVLMSEWHTINEGKLARGRVVFDTRQFNAVVGRA